jgi:hypothetical protein
LEGETPPKSNVLFPVVFENEASTPLIQHNRLGHSTVKDLFGLRDISVQSIDCRQDRTNAIIPTSPKKRACRPKRVPIPSTTLISLFDSGPQKAKL